PKIFSGGDLVFISGKFVVENSEQCVTITYASIIDNNPSHEFDTTSIPPCIPHCMFSVVVNRKPKELGEFIYFGVKCTEYNSVTGSTNVNMQMTVLYHAGSSRFQNYLGHSAAVTYNAHENYSSSTPGAQSIIDIIANDIESTPTQVPKVVEPTISSVNCNATATPGSSENLVNPDYSLSKRDQKQSSDYIDLDEEDKQSDYDDNEKDTELDEEEEKTDSESDYEASDNNNYVLNSFIKNNTIESFFISTFNNKLTTANLRIDYQFRGSSLHNICLYDYAANIQKVSINSHELPELTSQNLSKK
ncbi:26284_t:CDS:2, partial [Dentiscutata erythropus]